MGTVTVRPWIVLAAGMLAYTVSVFQRSSLGVAAVEATERFEVNAAALSTLAVSQLIVYAAMQVPSGVLLDRLGPRVMLTAGAIVMVAGQATLALAPSLGVALIGRVLVGAGDAASFISLLRLVAMWFDRRHVPVLSQVVGSVGQLGQVISAFPFFFVLHLWGWTPAYLSAAAISVITGLVVLVVVRSPPGAAPHGLTWSQSFTNVRAGALRPGTQLGFWAHFVATGPANLFALLWGFPFLSVGLGYGPDVAAGLLTLMVLAGAIAGPVIGILTGRFPLRRSTLVLTTVAIVGVAWASVLAWPGQPPFALVVALVVVTSVAGSAGVVGMDIARTSNPPASHGSVTGFVNVGGFSASLIMMFLIGVALDLVDEARGGTGVPAELYSLPSFRIAFLVQFLVVGIGLVFLLRARRAARRRLLAEEGIAVSPMRVAIVEAWRARRR
jgi:MFS family permease